jgi:hypothetical protein
VIVVRHEEARHHWRPRHEEVRYAHVVYTNHHDHGRHEGWRR